MKRFNLLLLSRENNVGRGVIKTISKVFKNNFVFELTELSEAEKLLGKLNIHVLLVDLDAFQVELETLSAHFPQTYVMGIHSSKATIASVLQPFRNKIYRKEALEADLLTDLRTMRKKPGVHPASKKMSTAGVTNFKDFLKLAPN